MRLTEAMTITCSFSRGGRKSDAFCLAYECSEGTKQLLWPQELPQYVHNLPDRN